MSFRSTYPEPDSSFQQIPQNLLPLVFTDGYVQIEFDAEGFNFEVLPGKEASLDIRNGTFTIVAEFIYSIQAALFATVFPFPVQASQLQYFEFNAPGNLQLDQNRVRMAFKNIVKTRLGFLSNGHVFHSSGLLPKENNYSIFRKDPVDCQLNGVECFEKYFTQSPSFLKMLLSKNTESGSRSNIAPEIESYSRSDITPEVSSTTSPSSYVNITPEVGSTEVVGTDEVNVVSEVLGKRKHPTQPPKRRIKRISHQEVVRIEGSNYPYPNPRELLYKYNQQLRKRLSSGYHIAKPVPEFDTPSDPPYIDEEDIRSGELWAKCSEFKVWISSHGRCYRETQFSVVSYDYDFHKTVFINGKNYCLMLLLAEAFLEDRNNREVLCLKNKKLKEYRSSNLFWFKIPATW